jgi:hypothetical protein
VNLAAEGHKAALGDAPICSCSYSCPMPGDRPEVPPPLSLRAAAHVCRDVDHCHRIRRPGEHQTVVLTATALEGRRLRSRFRQYRPRQHKVLAFQKATEVLAPHPKCRRCLVPRLPAREHAPTIGTLQFPGIAIPRQLHSTHERFAGQAKTIARVQRGVLGPFFRGVFARRDEHFNGQIATASFASPLAAVACPVPGRGIARCSLWLSDA